MTRILTPAALACVAWLALPAADAAAEKVRGKETCTAGSYSRTIGGKKYTCATKCTTPVTDTTCNPNCSTTVSNEVTYKDCSEAASVRPRDTFVAPPTGGILEVDPGLGGGGRTSPTGPVRPPAPAAPVLR
jgi:hypothetical protein